MEYRFSLFRLSVRLSTLAILCASLAFVWAESKVNADGMTTCIQCDSNNVNGLSTCSSTRDSCINNCSTMPSPPPGCTDTCWTRYNNCTAATWSNYDNCLYGFTDGSGLCAITGTGGTPPPSGRGKTPCDFACRDQMLDCRANDGMTCGEDYNSCKLGCG
jgi:hypothetical protein